MFSHPRTECSNKLNYTTYLLIILYTKWRRLYFHRPTFQIPTATIMKRAVFWDVEPCSLADIKRHFTEAQAR